jgi:tetratricopeptide (TPR) repeat protein
LFPQVQGQLRGQNMTYTTNPFGLLWQRTVPALPAAVPLNVRLDYAELVNQISNTYEMTCLSLPNRQVQPLESWQTRVPVLLINPLSVANQKKEFVDLIVTCTYLGRRVHQEQDQAVITLSGTVHGRNAGPQSATGTVRGMVHVLIEQGFVSKAKMTVESESGDGDMTVAHAVEVSLTRSSGNTAGIKQTPVQPPPPGSVTRGPLVFQAENALAATDPADCPGKPGCYYKVRPMNLTAGTTYIIEMDKVGVSGLDPYLVLVDGAGQIVAQDDDSGGNLNARIVYKCSQTGTFRIYATALIPRMVGMFRLAVSQASGDMPVVASPEHDLAGYFASKRDYPATIVCLEKVVALNPKLVQAHADLGFAYNEARLFDKAIPCLTKVIELDPKHAIAHNNLGAAYNVKGLYDEAIPWLKKAIELNPKNASAYNNLGFAYNARGLHDKGSPFLQKAIELQPHPSVYDNLGQALEAAGELTRALDAYRQALALIPQADPRFQVAKNTVEQMELLVALEPRLADIVAGERTPTDFQEGTRFGKLCRLKQHYAAALRHYEQAFTRDPDAAKKVSPSNLPILARTALLASVGSGSDPPPEAARSQYRAKALAWLRDYLKAQEATLDKDLNANRYSCQKDIRLLLQHKDFASVRSPALKELPENERKDWESLWRGVDRLIQKAEAVSPPESDRKQ